MTHNFRAALIVIGVVTLMVACSVRAQNIYRSGAVYSDKPIGARVYIVDNTAAAFYAPYEAPAPVVYAAPPAPAPVIVQVTVNNPAPVIQPVYVFPQRNYLAAPGWRNHHGYR